MTAKTKTQLGITIYSALIGSLVGVTSFAFLAGGKVEKWDASAAQTAIMYPLVIKHEAQLNTPKVVPPATFNNIRYEELPSIPYTELPLQ